jgi:hypothetical protein
VKKSRKKKKKKRKIASTRAFFVRRQRGVNARGESGVFTNTRAYNTTRSRKRANDERLHINARYARARANTKERERRGRFGNEETFQTLGKSNCFLRTSSSSSSSSSRRFLRDRDDDEDENKNKNNDT